MQPMGASPPPPPLPPPPDPLLPVQPPPPPPQQSEKQAQPPLPPLPHTLSRGQSWLGGVVAFDRLSSSSIGEVRSRERAPTDPPPPIAPPPRRTTADPPLFWKPPPPPPSVNESRLSSVGMGRMPSPPALKEVAAEHSHLPETPGVSSSEGEAQDEDEVRNYPLNHFAHCCSSAAPDAPFACPIACRAWPTAVAKK